jgi:hypothetical protein
MISGAGATTEAISVTRTEPGVIPAKAGIQCGAIRRPVAAVIAAPGFPPPRE